MSKSVPDLEQALARTSRGRARRPVEPHEDRSPRVMIAIHVDPEVRDQLREIAYEQKGPAARPGLRRAQRRLRPAPQTRNRPLIRSSATTEHPCCQEPGSMRLAALQRAPRPITDRGSFALFARVWACAFAFFGNAPIPISSPPPTRRRAGLSSGSGTA